MKSSLRCSRYRRLIPALAVCLVASGCLKTRAQLRQQDDDNSAATPQPAQVQPVQPQGEYVIDELKDTMTRLEGRIEDLERAQNQNNAASTANANKDDLKKLETRVTELEQTQAQILEAIKKLQDAPPQAADPTQAFNDGKEQFNDQDYDAAIESFSTYLKIPKIKHVEDATFLRAESYYKTKQYKKAIVDYSKFPERYTQSRYMPQALYRIGLSFDSLGMHEDAKGFYQELVEKFPRTNEARKAKAKLK